jgi:hypothetical protein
MRLAVVPPMDGADLGKRTDVRVSRRRDTLSARRMKLDQCVGTAYLCRASCLGPLSYVRRTFLEAWDASPMTKELSRRTLARDPMQRNRAFLFPFFGMRRWSGALCVTDKLRLKTFPLSQLTSDTTHGAAT